MKLKESDIVFKKCSPEHFKDICRLQEITFEHLDNKDLLRRNTTEMLKRCLEEPHYTLGAFLKEELVAFAILFDAELSDENIGLDLDFSEEELIKTINMKLIIVLPEYRGNGLQKKLMTLLEEIAKKRNKRFICGTVSPKNKYSCKNFELLNYVLKTTKIKYDGLERNIYCKEIE